MAYKHFLIAPINSGLQNNLRPFMIPDDAFEMLRNAYVFRGRIRKRFGSQFMNGGVDYNVAQLNSRLRINLGTISGSPQTFNIPPTTSGSQLAIGQMFSTEDTMLTVNQLGAAVATLSTSLITTATIDSTATPNTVTITSGTLGQDVYYYPANPVMGLLTYETGNINDEPTFAFDTQFSYKFVNGGWEPLDTTPIADLTVWTGTDSQFFWGYTYRGVNAHDRLLFVTNFNVPDRMRYWNGTAWNDYHPIVNNTTRLQTARIIVGFHDRLVFLNTVEVEEGTQIGTTQDPSGNLPPTIAPGGTWEVGQSFKIGPTVFTVASSTPGPQPMTRSGPDRDTGTASTGTFNVSNGEVVITGNTENPGTPVYYLPNTGTGENFFNRCRFSQNGDPTSGVALLEDIPGRGGYIDNISTSEQIITAEFLKDRLIVFFERSTWELVYTGNEILPFRWQQINTELGAESTFSIVPFDKVTLGVGNVGIHACNGSNVERIDDKIPDEVFEVSNDNEGVFRVYGIRDYFTETVYWTFPSEENESTYPNRVLIYNYDTGSWAFNDDSITCFGYFQNPDDITWGAEETPWGQASFKWNDASLQSKFRQVLAGNQEGFVFIVDSKVSRNAPSLQITDITYPSANIAELTIINHNVQEGDYIALENIQGAFGINDPEIFLVEEVIDSNTIQIYSTTLTGTYTGGGTVSLVSRIDILTKQYNFFMQDDRNVYIQEADFYVDRTAFGQITVDYFPSSTSLSMIQQGELTGAITGTSILETTPLDNFGGLENIQDRFWHSIYLQTEGEVIQMHIYFNDDQMLDVDIAFSPFTLNAMLFKATPTSKL